MPGDLEASPTRPRFPPLTTRAIGRLWALARPHWAAITTLALFAASAFVVPTLAPVATTDDWGYSRSVEILYHDGELTVFPVVAATAVFQIVWGWVFALFFGMSLGVMRVATVVMVALGAVALYALLRQLGVDRGRSALGMAAYLFNPLTFVLAFTFMTDPYFTSLLVIATAFTVRGLRDDPLAGPALVAGSAAAACAFLVRQQGALIPLAVVGFLLLSGRLRPNRRGIGRFLQATVVPGLAIVGYYAWLRYFNDVPAVQEGFLADARRRGLDGAWQLVRHLTAMELVYLGFFCLPLAAALLPGLRTAVRTMRPTGWLLFTVLQAAVIVGVTVYWMQGRLMPYIGQFVGTGGLGAPDVRGSRPRNLDVDTRQVITIVCAVAALVVLFVLCRGLGMGASQERTGALLVATIAVWQIVGVVPPSFQYLRRGYSLDRYLLPLLPLAICLVLWAARDLRLFRPVGWLLVAVFAAYAVAGTRDYLVYMDAVWDLAAEAERAGIAETQIDAGAAWDGYHLYTDGVEQGITRARTRDGPWWLAFYGKATDSSYVVSSRPQKGYVVVWKRPYSAWLEDDPTHLYLLSRPGLRLPP